MTLFALTAQVSNGYGAVVIVQAGVFAEASQQLVRYVDFFCLCAGSLKDFSRVLAQVELDFNSVECLSEVPDWKGPRS